MIDRRAALIAKRAIDLGFGAALVILALPAAALTAAAIKLTSPGPVFFRQERVGRGGRRFTLLKFRSMHARSDPEPHHSFVREFINGDLPGGVFKLRDDPRVTRVGKILRRTSLDELPQLLNVLGGSMSLVGPRPPIPYEVDAYAAWHLGRLAVKPGITGLWQVRGRSRIPFDEMVRLDLQYVSTWTLWLDFRILCLTPRAVVNGDGAR